MLYGSGGEPELCQSRRTASYNTARRNPSDQFFGNRTGCQTVQADHQDSGAHVPGWVFLGYARDILAKTAQAKNRLAGHFEDQIQPFIIGCHSSFELTMLPEALRRLTKAYPQVHPDIKMVPSQALRNLLQEETLDVMLGFGRIKKRKNRHLCGTDQSACGVRDSR